jgi:hypothetical protein
MRNILCDEKVINGLQLLCVVGPSFGWDDGKKYPRRFSVQFWSPRLKLCPAAVGFSPQHELARDREIGQIYVKSM